MNTDYVHKDSLTATDYIELQKENEKIMQFNQLLIKEKNELKKKIATYEDPEDLTLMYMYCDIKAKDKIEELKNQLKEKEEYINKLQTTKDKLDKCNVENTKHQTKFKNYLLFESEKNMKLIRNYDIGRNSSVDVYFLMLKNQFIFEILMKVKEIFNERKQ